MKIWKYVIIGVLLRLLLSFLHGRVPDAVGWTIFGVIILVLLFLLQRDIRYWIGNRKVNDNEAVK